MPVRVTLRNRTAVIHASGEEYDRLSDFWSFSPKGLWYMPAYKQTKIIKGQREVTAKQIERLKKRRPLPRARISFLEKELANLDIKLAGLWDGKIRLMKNHVVSSGLFRATWKEAEETCRVKFLLKKDRYTLRFKEGLPDAAEQYRHQNECTRKMKAAIPRGGGIVLAATRSGKTAITARLFSKVECDCLFVVDQLDLLYQQKKELEDWLHEKVGVVGDSVFQPERVTVATIQTLNLYVHDDRFQKWFRGVDVMVVDELHEQMAKRNFKVLETISPVAVFGLTATLQLRQKEVRMKAFAFAGPVIFEFPIKEGVKRKVLTKGYALQLLFRQNGAARDYREDLILQVVENDFKLQACEAVVQALIALDRHVVVLVDRVQHLQDVSDVLSCIPHETAYGKVKVDQRAEAKRLFEDEDIRLLVANKVFKKGITIKRIDAMIDMAEGKSKNDAVQKFGRGLGLCQGKNELIYVDFGTDGGRFGTAAASRRNALRKAGIDVTVNGDVATIRDVLNALSKFVRKVTRGDGNHQTAVDS